MTRFEVIAAKRAHLARLANPSNDRAGLIAEVGEVRCWRLGSGARPLVIDR